MGIGRASVGLELLEPRRMLSGNLGVTLRGGGLYIVSDTETFNNNNSFVIAGNWSGTIDFQPGGGTTRTADGLDGFIARYSDNNKLLWLYTITGKGDQAVDAVGVDPRNKDILWAGDFLFKSSIPIGAGTQSMSPGGLQDMMLGRVSLGGIGIRVAQIGGSDKAHSIVFPTSVDVNLFGEPVVSGGFQGTVDFDPGAGLYPIPGPNDVFSGFVATYHAKNGFKWSDGTLADTDDILISSALWNAAGTDVFAAGDVSGDTILDTFGVNTPLHAGTNSAGLFTLLDGVGHSEFVDLLQGSADVNIVDMMFLKNRMILIGPYDGTVDLNPGKGKFVLQQPVVGSSSSSFLGEYDLNGSLQTGFALGASSSLLARHLVPLPNDRFAVVGRFRGNVDINPDPNSEFLLHSKKKIVNGKPKLSDDIFYAIFDELLEFENGIRYGGTGNEVVRSVFFNPLHNSLEAALLPNGLDPESTGDFNALIELPLVP